MLGVFSKVVYGQEVKTRLRGFLSRQEAEQFHVASLADTLETVLQAVEAPVLFLRGGESPSALDDLRDRLAHIGLDTRLWSRLELRPQEGNDLGERLENAFTDLCGHPDARGALVVGSDSPHLPMQLLRQGLESLHPPYASHAPCGDEKHGHDTSSLPAVPVAEPPDLVLGPSRDGGYWAIGVRRPIPGLLRNIAWSTGSACADTLARAQALGLRTQLLEIWSDVDRPEDLRALDLHVRDVRRRGDQRTGRHCERFFEYLRPRAAARRSELKAGEA